MRLLAESCRCDAAVVEMHFPQMNPPQQNPFPKFTKINGMTKVGIGLLTPGESAVEPVECSTRRGCAVIFDSP